MPEPLDHAFRIEESRDAEGRACLAVSGELDLAVKDRLEGRISQLGRPGAHVRLDLSGLTFIDSTGIRVLIGAVRSAQRTGWDLEVDPELSRPVRRVVELLGVDGLLWSAESV